MTARPRTARLTTGAIGAVAIALALLTGCVAGAQAAGRPFSVAVDASAATGDTVRQDVAGVAYRPGAQAELQALGTTFTRYGSGVNDDNGLIHVLFPRRPGIGQTAATVPMNAQALARYDGDVDAMDATGARLSVTLDSPGWLAAVNPDGGDDAESTQPPADPQAFERLVERTITHFTVDRVAQGKRPILNWDAWNEPDNPIYYRGTEAQWLTNILTPEATAVRAVARRSGLPLRFGGCACLFADTAWMGPMFTYARQNAVHLDFVTWHFYGNYPFLGPDGPEAGYSTPGENAAAGRLNPAATPTIMGTQADLVRSTAQQDLGYVPALVNNEWNLSAGGLDHRQDTNDGAAFDAASLIEFQQHGVDAGAFETAIDPFPSLDGNDLHGDLGLMSRGGIRKPSWWTFRLFGDLAPQVVASVVTGAAPAPDGVEILASRTPSRDRVTVLMASWSASAPTDRIAHLTVGGLGAGRWTATVRRIDAQHSAAANPIARSAYSSGGMDVALPAQSLALVQLDRPGLASVNGSGPPGRSGLGLPVVRGCLSRRTIVVHLPRHGAGLRSAVVRVGGRVVRQVRGPALRRGIVLRHLPAGRVSVRIVARTTSGRRLVARRRYRTCAPRRPRSTVSRRAGGPAARPR